MSEQSFRDALRIEAGDAGTPSLTLDSVQARARSIRRRRAGAAAGGAAVLVAAAVVPIALLAGGDSSRDTLPPVSTPTVSDTANPEQVSVDQRGTYVVGDEIHPAEGEPFTPEIDGEVTTVIGLSDGRWVLGADPDGGAFAVVVVDSSGEVMATYDAVEGALTSDGAGGAVAWQDPDLRPRSLVAGQDEPLRWESRLVSNRAGAALLTVLPGCTEEACELVAELYFVTPDEESTLTYVASDGAVGRYGDPGLQSLSDVSADGALVAGVVSSDEEALEYCSAVIVLATGDELWRTCEAGAFRFSPDGRYVLGIDPYQDGFGHSFVTVLDALEGTPVGSYGGGTIFDETWLSGTEFLVSQQLDDGTDQLLRVAVDGTLQTVIEQSEGTLNDPSPLRLTGR